MINTKKNFLLEDKNRTTGNDFHIVCDPKEETLQIYLEKDGVKTETFVDKGEFWSVAFAIADEKKQEMLIPTDIRPVKTFYKQIKINPTKDIKKGEPIICNVKFTVPLEVLVQASQNKSGLIIPE